MIDRALHSERLFLKGCAFTPNRLRLCLRIKFQSLNEKVVVTAYFADPHRLIIRLLGIVQAESVEALPMVADGRSYLVFQGVDAPGEEWFLGGVGLQTRFKFSLCLEEVALLKTGHRLVSLVPWRITVHL